MDDLGRALAGGNMLMLGGGNPSHIPEIETLLRARMREIAEDAGAFARLVGDYDPPQGDCAFIVALAALLRGTYGWPIGPEHIALTNGSQAAFFALFNMIAGEFDDGTMGRVLLPLTPEYVGYADQGLSARMFRGLRPRIELLDDHTFKYRIDFDNLGVDAETRALCVSRPTNPTGNVLTDAELGALAALAAARDVPLIVDNAYGVPFPGIVFTDARPIWNEHVILTMSLSKFGVPALRTGIVIARPEVIERLVGITAVSQLTPGSVGPVLLHELVRSGRILELSRDVVRPFYRVRMELAVAAIRSEFRDFDYFLHAPEGALFLWLWFPSLSVSSAELYRRLKARGVLVLSGHFFFPGLAEPWEHTQQCLRVTYAQDPDVVRAGVRIIAEEVRGALREAR
jgi:valine--pyruvate aminotransferase